MSARRVVTLPPGLSEAEAVAFAREARRHGADLLEVRNDLHPPSFELAPVAACLQVLASERGQPLPSGWTQRAALSDRPIEAGHFEGATLLSCHAEAPLAPQDAVRRWEAVGPGQGVHVKHVEPLGSPADGLRLLETQRLLQARFGAERVTVLATGPLALPLRCLLARRNALDYLALSGDWAAAPGQRLLDDAVREQVRCPTGAEGARLGILGTRITGSRSPRIHPQPFDRIDLPEDSPVGALLDALHPFYKGFAVTSPFKKPVARHVGDALDAVNTLVRTKAGWRAANTDVEGARAALRALGAGEVTALGDGGVTASLRMAAEDLGVRLRIVTRNQVDGRPLRGALVWTWPGHLEAPPALAFLDAQVAVVSYGAAGRGIGAEIRRRGGAARMLGARWFIAQARAQRRLWQEAE